MERQSLAEVSIPHGAPDECSGNPCVSPTEPAQHAFQHLLRAVKALLKGLHFCGQFLSGKVFGANHRMVGVIVVKLPRYQLICSM